ncbi:MAG TPA: hypothetical protein VLR49_09570, partial [Ferruginibacter sp.]|nr:hypothetical protein [Ferruginibacter sp.]
FPYIFIHQRQNKLMLEVIHNIKELYPLKDELEKIYTNQSGLNFYSPNYVIKCFEHFLIHNKSNRLFFIVVKRNHLIVAYLPLYIDKNKILRFVFDKHTDYCACVGEQLDHLSVKDLCKIILQEKEIRGIEFDNLLPADELLNYTRHYLGTGSVIFSYNNHSFLETKPGEGMLLHLKSKEKSELKRITKKNEAFPFEIFDRQMEYPLQKVKALRDSMIKSKTRGNDFLEDNFIDFTRLLFEAGELEIFAKSDGERLVSASFVLINNKGKRIVWIDMYDDVPFVNLSAYIEYINHLEKNNLPYLSLGRGSYDYKSKNFLPQIENLYNLRYHKSKFHFLFTNFHPIKQFVKRLMRKAS